VETIALVQFAPALLSVQRVTQPSALNQDHFHFADQLILQ